jgi:hypothetical protein
MVRNITLLILVAALVVVSMIVGSLRISELSGSKPPVNDDGVPSIGRIQILNGSGVSGVAKRAADFLRSKGFDVKNTGNAPTSNYEFTIVISRTGDMKNAQRIGGALGTEKVIMMRDSLSIYDVDVFIGADYAERIK